MERTSKDPPKAANGQHRDAAQRAQAQADERKDALLRVCLAKAKQQRQKGIETKRRSAGSASGSSRGEFPHSALLLASLHEHASSSHLLYQGRNESPPAERRKEEEEEKHDASDEDEILALLGGDRDLYLSLMADLEDALRQELDAEEAEEARQLQLCQLESWEEAQGQGQVQEMAMYEAMLRQAREREQELHQEQEHGAAMRGEEDDPQNSSMQVLFNENSCDSAGSCSAAEGAEEELPDEASGLGFVAADVGGGEVDYLVCPVCKRQCMDLRNRAHLAECRCGASLFIGRNRHLAAQAAAGRSAVVAPLGPSSLSIEEIKTIISDSMEAHRLSCPVLQGAPLTIDFVEFRLQQLPARWAGHADHPFLHYHCSHCGNGGYVV